MLIKPLYCLSMLIPGTLNNPDDAKRYVNRTEALRKISENAAKAFEGLGKAISNLFNNK